MTCPISVDGVALPGHLALLEEWLRNNRVEELFEADGRLMPVLAKRAPDGERRMGENPHANGAILLRDLEMPGFCVYACDVATPAIPGIGDTRRRTIHANLQVRGYKEEGTVTTPFDMTVRNDPDRFHRLMVSIDRLPQTGEKRAAVEAQPFQKLVEHRQYLDTHGHDMPEVRDCKWKPYAPALPDVNDPH